MAIAVEIQVTNAFLFTSVAGLTLAGSALAQTLCEPMPATVIAKFATRAVALDFAQRQKIASVVHDALQYSFYYVLIEPKAAESEGTKAEREDFARRRGQYIHDVLVRYGVQSTGIKIGLEFVLNTDSPSDH